MKPSTASWFVFIILAGIMGYLRYGGCLRSAHLSLFGEWGPFVIVAIHVVLVLRAFKDSVFQGILCILIPLYSFYYLFIVSDEFYLRAVVAGILVGVGQDSAPVFQQIFSDTTMHVQRWIASGG